MKNRPPEVMPMKRGPPEVKPMKSKATRGEAHEEEATRGETHEEVRPPEVKPMEIGKKPQVGKEGTYNVGNPRCCVEASREVFFVYVGIHRRNILVSFRQVTTDAEFVRCARLLDLHGY